MAFMIEQGTTMGTKILDGVKLKKKILSQLTEEISALQNQVGKKPGLAVILVGDNPASHAYVSMKKKACEQIGIESLDYRLTGKEGQDKLIQLMNELNNNVAVNGILMQLPLPEGYDEQKMLELIAPEKDVDGFHPINVGKLLLGLPTYRSCTPYGVCELFKEYEIETEGKHIVIIGRSNIVGKPLAAMMVQKTKPGNATVTVCHSRSKNIVDITKQADILVAAIGRPHFVKENMIKEGAVVIDVGINRVDAPETDKGYKLVGDVDYDAVEKKASAITPVPGGVGPLTIAMLMKNTLQAFKQQNQIDK